ncbi:MAG: hypothetical protein CL521_03820 [Actinobacteria bacterium]|nr:hypothetical protein [Actinomycetota bacterium]
MRPHFYLVIFLVFSYFCAPLLAQEGDAAASDDAPVIESKQVKMTEELLEAKRKIKRLLKQKQYTKIKALLDSLPADALDANERRLQSQINTFEKVEALEKENNAMFGADESQEESLVKSLKRLYRGAKKAIIEQKPQLAQDLLIQILFMDRKNFKAKKLLELGLNKPLGTYTVQNMEARYWRSSITNYYSGFPSKSVDDLVILSYFDPENPLIFERMGSSYYSMGETKEAIKSWKRALYFRPNDKNLKDFVANAEKELSIQEARIKSELAAKKDRQKQAVNDENYQTLRIVADSNTAYEYAQEVQTQLKEGRAIVVEMDDGRYAVKVPKKGQAAAKKK